MAFVTELGRRLSESTDDPRETAFLFSARQHAERAICYRKSVCLSVCPSVCLSVTRVDQSKTVERIIEILSPPDRPNILVFRHAPKVVA